MKVKVHIPTPKVHTRHVEHTAAVFTIAGVVAAYYPPLHMLEGLFFGAGGFIAIYANRFGHVVAHVVLNEDETETV